MRRRALLASTAAGIAALAGCLDTTASPDDGDSSPGDPTPSGDPTPTHPTPADPTPGAEVSLESLRLQYGVVTPTSPDSIGVTNPDTPYLVASVRVEGSLSRDGFALVVGGERSEPTTLDRLYRTSWGDDAWYERGRREGLLLFEPPRTANGDLRVTWPGGERSVDPSIRTRLDGSPPHLSASLDVPATHDGAEAPPIEIAVTNEAGVPGRFLGALNRVGPRIAYTPVVRASVLVAGGDTVRIPVSDDWSGLPGEERIGDGEADVTYHLDHAGGEDSAGIRIVEAS